MKIRWRIFIAVILLLEATAGGMWLVMSLWMQQELYDSARAEAIVTLRFAAAASDEPAADTILTRLIADTPGLDAVYAFDRSGALLARTTRPGAPAAPAPWSITAAANAVATGRVQTMDDDDAIRVAGPVVRDGRIVGAVAVRFNAAPLHDRVSRLWWVATALGFLIIGAGYGAAVVGSGWFARPLRQLAAVAGDMRRLVFRSESLSGIVIRKDEIGEFARVFEEMAREVVDRDRKLEAKVAERTAELAAANAALGDANSRLEADLAAARTLQLSLLPRGFPVLPQIEAHALMVPERAVGGDFYDIVTLDGQRIAILVGDVAGKGAAAALFMAMAKAVLHTACLEGRGPAGTMMAANRALCADNRSNRHVTVVLGVLDVVSGEFCYTMAGHPAPLVVDTHGAVRELERATGPVLGTFERAEFVERRVVLRAGETLVLYSDGVTEAFDEEDEEFGFGRMAEFLAARANGPVAELAESLADEVGRFAGAHGQRDDLTLLAVRWCPADRMSDDEGRLSLVLEPRLEGIAAAAADIDAFCDAAGLGEAVANDLNVVVEELASNAIRHGGGVRRIGVTLGVVNGVVTLVVEDDGQPFDPTGHPPPALDGPLAERRAGGLGLHFVRNLMHSVAYARVDGRNRVTLERQLDPPLL